jgi:hypothetical protein
MEKTKTHHHYTHNNYLKELETVLAGVKAQLIENEHAAQVDYKSKQITERASEHDKRVKKQYNAKTQHYLKDLTEMFNTSYELQLLSDKIIAMATIGGGDETTVAAKVATSARSIEAALESVQAMSSLAASINAKALTDTTSKNDTKSPIAKAAAEVNEKGLEAGKAADIATMSSLHTTIFAAESNARFLVSDITDFSTAITALTTNITQTKTDAATNASNAFDALQAALKQASEDEKALEQSFLNWQSAKEANDEDNIKLGLREAQKQVIEDERKAAATAAAANQKK